MLSYSITILISYISMMYSKRKTLHYITKEMYFLCNSFVTTRPYPLIFMDNRLIHRIVQKKNRGKNKYPSPILLLSCFE